MHRIVVVLAVLAGALVVVPVAAAATPGRTVATLDGATLRARTDDRGRLCLRLQPPAPAGATTLDCRAAPVSPYRPVMVPTSQADVLGLAVPTTVAVVTAQDGDRVRRFDAPAEPGFDARFVLVGGTSSETLLRFYDAAGTLVGAARDEWSEPTRGRVVLRRGGATVRVRRTDRLVPTPLQPDRTEPLVCLGVDGGRGASDGCQPASVSRFEVDATTLCARGRTLVSGLVAPRVRQVELVLGSGRTVRAATLALPAGLGETRLAAVSAPPGQAVRAARGRDAAGRVVGRRRLGRAPAPPGCDDVGVGLGDTLTAGSRGRPRAPLVPVVASGGKTLRAGDGADDALCLGRGGADPACGSPPVDADLTVLVRRGRVLDGVLSQDVARVDLQLDDGSLVRAPVTTGAAYTGRYAGRVRFLSVALEPGRRVRRAVARDLYGRRLGNVAVVPSALPRVTGRRFAPGLTLVRIVLSSERERARFACVTPSRFRPGSGSEAALYLALSGVCTPDGGEAQVLAHVACRPRGALLLGTPPRGATGVTVVTSAGRLTAPLRRVRGLGRFWTLAVPRTARVEAIEYAGRLRPADDEELPARVPLALPPAAAQCGYTAARP